MQTPRESLLQHLPAETPDQRVVVYLIQEGTESRIELRQQSWGDGVGWYTQSTIQMDTAQWTALRGGVAKPRAAAANWRPRVVRAESA